MKKIVLVLLSSFLLPVISFGQVVNRTTDNNYKGRATFGTQTDTYTPTDTTVWLQIGENNTTKGILMPRLADTTDYVGTPIAGIIIYQNLDNKVYYYNGNYWQNTGYSFTPNLLQVTTEGNYTNTGLNITGITTFNTDSITMLNNTQNSSVILNTLYPIAFGYYAPSTPGWAISVGATPAIGRDFWKNRLGTNASILSLLNNGTLEIFQNNATPDTGSFVNFWKIPTIVATEPWVQSQNYLIANQPITLSGDVTGSGTTAITTTLKNTGTAGTYTRTTFDAEGRETSGTDTAYLPLSSFGNYKLENDSTALTGYLTHNAFNDSLLNNALTPLAPLYVNTTSKTEYIDTSTNPTHLSTITALNDTVANRISAIPSSTLHAVLYAGDTATNDINLGGDARIMIGSTTGGNGGELQYLSNNFNISTVSLANPVLIDGSDVAIGSNNTGENVGIGTNTPAYKLDVSGNTRLQNNLSIAGDSLRVWNKTYSINALPAAGIVRANISTNLNTTASYTSPTTGIDLFNAAGSLEYDNANSISFPNGTGGTISCGTCGITSLNASGTSTWIYSGTQNVLSGLSGWLRVFNNANYGLLSGIGIPDAYTFTQGSYTSFSGVIDSLAQLALYAPINGYSVSTKANKNYGILQLSSYPNSYNGGVQMPIVTSSVGYTVTTANYTVINTAGTNTFTMPAASTCNGQIFHLICNSGTVTLSIGYLNYSGTNTTSIAAGSGVTVQSNGTNYYQIGQ